MAGEPHFATAHGEFGIVVRFNDLDLSDERDLAILQAANVALEDLLDLNVELDACEALSERVW